MTTQLEQYTDAALAGDRSAAASIAAEFAGADDSCERLVTELLAPSQRLVGDRWQHELCSVGAEHAATFVTESVLASLAVGNEPRIPAGTIVIVCAEGEWHALPARMASELLIADGWRVIHLGPATPAAQLRTYLAGVDADAVGVSATVAGNLTGAARTVRVARQLGFPVLCGGAAFDAAGRRARAIGASGQPRDLAAGLSLDDVVWGETALPDTDDDWAYIDFERVRIVRDALTWLGSSDFNQHDRASSWLEHVAAELDAIVSVVAAAVLCDDPSIVAEHRTWFSDRLESVGTPAGAAHRSFDAIAAVIDDIVPNTSSLLA